MAASNGDTVLVAPGTYVENINFLGKNITVTSSAGAATTIIDGNNNGTVVTFTNGETAQAVLNGFTIQHGAIPPAGGLPNGIEVNSASPTITNNVVTNNRGYGIEVDYGAPVIQNNTISNTTTAYNPAQDFGCDYDDGSGIYVNNVPSSGFTLIEGNTIQNNVAHCGGGGIRIAYGPVPHIINNRILYNQTLGNGGGGIYMFNGGQVWIVQNLIAGNIAASEGGGICISAGSDVNGNSGPVNSYVVNNTIVGNTIVPNGDIGSPGLIDGSQVGFPGYVSQAGLYNNLIISADSYNAVACDPLYSYLSATPPVVAESDVFSLSGMEFGGWCTAQAGISAGVYQIISANPLFVQEGSQYFHLGPGSPALGTGDPTAPELPSTDINGSPRTEINGSETTVDMGIYEGAAPSSAAGTPSFTMQISPATLTLSNTSGYGVAAFTNVLITPSGHFFGIVSLQCTGLPSSVGGACFFSPVNVPAAGDNTPVTVQLLVEAQAVTAQTTMVHRHDHNWPLHTRGAWTALFLLLFIGLAQLRSRRWSPRRTLAVGAIAFLLSLTVPLCSCGGGASSGGTGNGGNGGNGSPYSITVVATASGNLQSTQTATVTFTISN
ncbi:MAG: right-handed parallel beta-helix repeat-containing protein [Candidatus Acidiferrales bacterium]